ncbi:hypothetical protein MSSIT_0187 [Methanosarcina siciliae T4/M]|uniref:Archaeal Type IV pilin N-terminal domain-containing protein n=2 Tax=Methanosarcina siciliae TaxID=38027 RepID=A0A0E3PA11_9EURY|nr:type IV pilin [Methanosarcina siciliae]AKB26906.1 hypothetical protein MSSIT_0187 [Methanosarcina siciliae T4/M]AKB30873.1 hypothetical protein MSSIH_0183 [Methanosarcina siciliae HI350]
MDLKKIFNDNKAVSPVIGVVLMVAITVILAAAIGSSVFGQGPAKSAPQANIDIKAVNASDPGYIKFEHLGGEPIYFNENSTTKVMAALDGTSVEIDATGLGTLDVGDMVTIGLNDASNNTSAAFSGGPSSGDTVNIKIIDVQTKQLICDTDVRF